MTKIGSGNVPGEEPSIEKAKSTLDQSSGKFLQALDQYNKSMSNEEQAHLKTVMDQQMAVIQSSIRELNKQGIHKEAAKVGKDYQDYKDEETMSNFTCLRNDVETLRDINKS